VIPWRRPRRRSWLDLTPLVDVVFTLLLFVLLASTFDQEETLELTLPQGGPSTTSSALVIDLVADGSVHVAGQPWLGSDLGSDVKRALGAGRNASVILRADASLPYARVFTVVSSLALAGVNVALAHEP